MRFSAWFAVSFALLSSSLHGHAADTGDLRIRFEYGGSPEQAAVVNVDKDVDFCGKHKLVAEHLLVDPTNKGIQNVIVYVYTGRGGSKLPEAAPAGATHTLANKNCRFEPHIVIAQAGDSLKVTNPDDVSHNANVLFFNNRPVNPMIPSGQQELISLEKPEPAPIPVECSIHQWMRAYVLVLDHPFAAVSDANGEMTMKGLPTGKLVFRAYQESARIKEVEIGGENVAWKRSRFEVDIKPGMNDLGTVVIPASAFK